MGGPQSTDRRLQIQFTVGRELRTTDRFQEIKKGPLMRAFNFFSGALKQASEPEVWVSSLKSDVSVYNQAIWQSGSRAV